MSRAVKLRNVFEYKTMLLQGNPQFENFYKEELIDFCKVARETVLEQQQENKQLKEQLQQNEEVIKEALQCLDTATVVTESIFHQRNTLKDILNKYKKIGE